MSPVFEGRIAIHSWTLDSTPLPEFLRVAREAGYDGVELRNVDFRRCHERGMAPEAVLDVIRGSGIRVSVIGAETGLLFATGDELSRLVASFERTCRNAVAVGCPMLMISPGQNAHSTAAYAATNLKRAAEIAAAHGVRLALEFNSRHPVINCIAVASEMLAYVASPSCGMLLDAYHMHFSGAGGRGFEAVPAEQIFAFQFSDAPPGSPSRVRSPTDRLPPGQGVVRWNDVFGLLAEKRYAGAVVYEAPNPAQWNRPPEEVAREGLAATRRLLAEAARAAGA